MKFRFDTIKNPSSLLILIPLNIFVPAFLWGILRTPDYREIIPPNLYQNNIIPLLLFFIPLIYFISHRKKLFWQETEIRFEDDKGFLIDNETFKLENLEYYEFLPGNMLSSGTRDSMNIKFYGYRKIKIIPCKSSNQISSYDDFVQEFLRRIEEKHPENKEKLMKNSVKLILLLILIPAIIYFIYVYYNSGSSRAFKMLPGILIAISVFLPFILKRKKKFRQ